jgi:hypothetical protein
MRSEQNPVLTSTTHELRALGEGLQENSMFIRKYKFQKSIINQFI